MSAHVRAGEYRLTFDRDVSSCSYQATQGGHDGVYAYIGHATASLSAGENKSVRAVTVQTLNSEGNFYDLPFSLAVFC